MLAREFFEHSPLRCARQLIGCELRWGACSGIVVESEAYDEKGDPACHTFFRPSAREFVAMHEPGSAYVYLNYGMHWLFNVLVKGRRNGFVLIRALEPVSGLAEMMARRKTTDPLKLCAGPGRLSQALGINKAHHGIDVCATPEFAFHDRARQCRIVADGRVGISAAQHLPWRFTLEGSRHVSVRPKPVKGAKEKTGTISQPSRSRLFP